MRFLAYGLARVVARPLPLVVQVTPSWGLSGCSRFSFLFAGRRPCTLDFLLLVITDRGGEGVGDLFFFCLLFLLTGAKGLGLREGGRFLAARGRLWGYARGRILGWGSDLESLLSMSDVGAGSVMMVVGRIGGWDTLSSESGVCRGRFTAGAFFSGSRASILLTGGSAFPLERGEVEVCVLLSVPGGRSRGLGAWWPFRQHWTGRSRCSVQLAQAGMLCCLHAWCASQHLLIPTNQGTALRVEGPSSIAVNSAGVFTVTVVDKDGTAATGSNPVVTANLKTGGGNGDGGVVTSADGKGLVLGATAGAVRFSLQFDRACSACVMSFTSPGLTGVDSNAFQITTKGVSLSAVPATLKTPRTQPVTVVVSLLDDQGNVDESWPSKSTQPTFTLLPPPNAEPGFVSGTLTATPSSDTKPRTFSLTFSRACFACNVEISSNVNGVRPLMVGPFEITTNTNSLEAAYTVSGRAAGMLRVVKDVPFDLAVRAKDEFGSTNRLDSGRVSVALAQVIDGQLRVVPPLAIQASLTQNGDLTTGTGSEVTKRLSDGTATIGLVTRVDCPGCVLLVRHVDNPSALSARIPTDGNPAVQAPPSGGDDGFDTLWLLLIIPLLLLVCLGVAAAAWWFLTKDRYKAKPEPQKEAKEVTESVGDVRHNSIDTKSRDTMSEVAESGLTGYHDVGGSRPQGYSPYNARGADEIDLEFDVDDEGEEAEGDTTQDVHSNPIDSYFGGLGGLPPSKRVPRHAPWMIDPASPLPYPHQPQYSLAPGDSDPGMAAEANPLYGPPVQEHYPVPPPSYLHADES